MIKFAGHSQLVERFRRWETFQRNLLRHYQIQAGEENMCLVSRYTNELEMEVRTLRHPKENEVLIRVGSCSISTYGFDDLMRFRGKDSSFDKTLVLGSFGTGIVLELGTGVEGMFNVGDRVALEPGINCQKCRLCMEGKTNLCPHIKYIGTEGLDGILCRFINHPAHFTHKLPTGVSLELGTLATKIAGCIHGYRRSGITKDSKILIMGTNLIGLLAIMIYKHLGVGSIIVAETNNYKLKMARNVGADYVIKLASLYSPEYPEYLKQIIDSIHSGESDIVIDTIGTASSIENSFNLVKSGGTLVLMSRMTRPVETKFIHSTLREIDLIGAYSYNRSSFIEALKLLSNDNIPLKKMIPIKIPLERALDAFSHSRATGGENLFILVNSYNEKEQKKDYKSSEEKTASIPDLIPVSQIPEPTKPPTPTGNELPTSNGSETEKGSEKKAASIPDLTPVSQIQEPTKPPTPTSKELPTSNGSEKEKGSEKKAASIPDLTPVSQIPEPTQPPTPAGKESPSNGSETEKGSEKKAASIPDLTPVSQIPEPTKPTTPTGKELPTSNGSETEPGRKEKKEVISSTTPQIDKLEKPNKEKVTSASPIDDKKKGEAEKEKIYEPILKPKSAEKNGNQPWPQDKEKISEKKETKQELSIDKKDEKLNKAKKTEKGNEEKKEVTSSSTPEIDKLKKHDKEKVTSTSSIDDKKKGETDKEKVHEVILKPKSAEENKNQPWPQDKEKTPEKKETEQDSSLDKKDEKKNKTE